MELTAMIPARLGSKRIPKKNIRYLGEKPLIRYPIELALQSGKFKEVWINTEDEALGRFAESLGVKFHKRPPELATGSATNREFTYEFLKAHSCDYVVQINSTSPLLRLGTLSEFLRFLEDNGYDTVHSVVSHKAETLYKGKPLNFSYAEKVNSQLLPAVELIVWALTAWKRDVFIKLQENGVNPVFGGKIGFFGIPKDESCDLDDQEDWIIAEGMLQSRMIRPEARYLAL